MNDFPTFTVIHLYTVSTKNVHTLQLLLTSSVSNITGLEENGDGSAFITGYASRELRGELSEDGTSSKADRGAGGWTVITILRRKKKGNFFNLGTKSHSHITIGLPFCL